MRSKILKKYFYLIGMISLLCFEHVLDSKKSLRILYLKNMIKKQQTTEIEQMCVWERERERV